MICPQCLMSDVLQSKSIYEDKIKFRCETCGFQWKTTIEAIIEREKERSLMSAEIRRQYREWLAKEMAREG